MFTVIAKQTRSYSISSKWEQIWFPTEGTLPETNSLHLKIDGWQMLEDYFPFWGPAPGLFSVASC